MIKKNVPNLITLLNLFFGCVAIVLAATNKFEHAALWVLMAAIADFFDGFAARVLDVKSNIGKELDSLADIVSFGVAPGVIYYFLLLTNQPHYAHIALATLIPYLAFLITAFSAIRLAIFNVSTQQNTDFMGLPTPANALMLVFIPYFLPNLNQISPYATVIFIVLITAISSMLLVMPVRIFSLKFKGTQFKPNAIRYIYLIVAVSLVLGLGLKSIPFVIILYIITSLIYNIFRKP